jgi:hypothetical protein
MVHRLLGSIEHGELAQRRGHRRLRVDQPVHGGDVHPRSCHLPPGTNFLFTVFEVTSNSGRQLLRNTRSNRHIVPLYGKCDRLFTQDRSLLTVDRHLRYTGQLRGTLVHFSAQRKRFL